MVAREFSLVSAAVDSQDAGSDAGRFEPHFGFGHGGSGPVVYPPPHFGPGGSSGVAPHQSKGDSDDSDSDRSGGTGGNGGTGGKSGEPKHS